MLKILQFYVSFFKAKMENSVKLSWVHQTKKK
jgi:hypothetical protein